VHNNAPLHNHNLVPVLDGKRIVDQRVRLMGLDLPGQFRQMARKLFDRTSP
jgi:hypothetical protein